MNSEERREARYQRRQHKRQENLEKRSRELGGIEEVVSFENLFRYGKKCCNGVRWKQSTQNFEAHLFSNTQRLREQILNGTWKQKKCTHFILRERGKLRPIDAPHITDRPLHKLLVCEVLRPLYQPSMIYDNGASQPGKGLHWHYKRLKKHLAWHYRRYGRQGAIALLDLKKFFPNANRALVYERHEKLILNARLRELTDDAVRQSPETSPGHGMPLGVELSQIEMVALPSAVDNYIKCQLKIHCAGHYADDYYIILPDIEELKCVVENVIAKFEALGIPVNPQKCHIVPLTESFRFCKARFTLTKTGRSIMNGSRAGMKSGRRKMHKFHTEWQEGKRDLQDIQQWLESQRAYYENYDDHGRVLKLNRMYHALFESKP